MFLCIFTMLFQICSFIDIITNDAMDCQKKIVQKITGFYAKEILIVCRKNDNI